MKFVQIHTLAVDDKTAEVTIKGPTSPMLAAQAVTKSDDFKKIPMTGLYELETEDKELFTTMLHADIDPRRIPIYCIELMFKHYVIIGDLGTDTLPILIDLGDSAPTVAPVYQEFPGLRFRQWMILSPPSKTLTHLRTGRPTANWSMVSATSGSSTEVEARL